MLGKRHEVNNQQVHHSVEHRCPSFELPKGEVSKTKKKQMKSLVRTSLNLLEYCLAKRETKVAAERFVPLLKLSNLKFHPDTV